MDRQYDLLLMQSIDQNKDSSLVNLDFGSVSSVVTGVQKAAQKWLVAFFTVKGTMLSDRTYGTSFLYNLRSVNAHAPSTIKSAFSTAVKDIQEWFTNNVDLENLPNDEVITDAELVDFNIDGTSLFLRVKLTTRDGDSRVYITPTSIFRNS